MGTMEGGVNSLFHVVKNRQGKVNDKIDKIDKLISLHTQYNQHNPINLLYSTPATVSGLEPAQTLYGKPLLSPWKRFGGIQLNATTLLYPCIQPHDTTHPSFAHKPLFAHQFLSKIPKVTSSTTVRQLSLIGDVWHLGSSQAIILPIPLKKFGVNAAIKVFPEEEQLKTALTNSCCSYKTASKPSLSILLLGNWVANLDSLVTLDSLTSSVTSPC